MGLRGPKPVDVQWLKYEAMQWANFFYMLREGQPGLVLRVQHQQDIIGAEIRPKLTYRQIEKFFKMVGKGTDEWKIVRPIFPNRGAWEQLKAARTILGLRRATDRIRRWARSVLGVHWKQAPIRDPRQFFVCSRMIRRHPSELLRAKQMQNYPRKHSTNDDKRIVFFAKVMAGLTFGLAPATATKRLGRWHCPKGQIEKKMFEALEQRYPMPKAKSPKQEKLK